MKRLWLYYFPLLFIPGLAANRATELGTIQFSDFLIVPFLALLAVSTVWGAKLNIGRLTPWMGVFVGWALLSTVTIGVRYGYVDNFNTEFGVLKVAKFVLYGFAGILMARSLKDASTRNAFHWSLVAAGVVVGGSLWQNRLDAAQPLTEPGNAPTLTEYLGTNPISVMAAIFLAYLGGLLLIGHGTWRWRICATLSCLAILAGAAASEGRGGWVAGIAAGAYILLRLGPRKQVVLAGLTATVIIATLYQSQPEFKRQVDITLFEPELEDAYQGTRTVGTVDDGGRYRTWHNEVRKLEDAPFLGTGVYHRGGHSPLWTTGSHNFWLQMFLETGIVGGLLVLGILAGMWRQATRLRGIHRRADIPLKAALVAAFVGGLSGEYFYGGVVLLALLAAYAPTGSLPLASLPVPERAIQQVRRHVTAPAPAPVGLAGTPGE